MRLKHYSSLVLLFMLILCEQRSAHATIQPTGKIVFARARRSDREVWVINADGSEAHKLTDLYTDSEPGFAWSPDGTRVAFKLQMMQIAIVNLRTNVTRVLLKDLCCFDSPQWSPDGKMLSFADRINATYQINVIHPDGSGRRTLIPPEAALNYADSSSDRPTWSPDGTRLAFVASKSDADPSRSLWIINADGTHLNRLPTPDMQPIFPVWSPDGMQIAFLDETEQFLYLIDVASAALTRLAPAATMDIGLGPIYPSWSPDGTQIAYARMSEEWAADLFAIDIKTHKEHQLTHGPLHNFTPSWSPDGNFIVYGSLVRNIDATQALMIMDADGSNPRMLTDGNHMDTWPVWSPTAP